MIIGIGTDIVEISRVFSTPERLERFIKRWYTENEVELCKKNPLSVATNFAGKEAVAKALGTGFLGFLPNDIEILRNEKGAPYCVLHRGALELAVKLGVSEVKISLSHSQDLALAFAVATGN